MPTAFERALEQHRQNALQRLCLKVVEENLAQCITSTVKPPGALT